MTDEEWDESYQQVYKRLYPLASSSAGYFSILEADALGFGPALREEAIARRVCAVINDAVMRLDGYPSVRRPTWFAAWLRCGRNKVMLSHETALHAYFEEAGGTFDFRDGSTGIEKSIESMPVHVTISETRDLPDVVPPTLTIHRGDVTEMEHLGGLPVTSFERTLADCAAKPEYATQIEITREAWAAHLEEKAREAAGRVTKGLVDLPPPAWPPRFADQNLALAVLDTLIATGHITLPALAAADEYERDEELYARLAAYPFTAEQLASIDRLVWEGGGMSIQHVVWPQWDGETDEFDIRTLAGIEQLVNLRELVLAQQSPVDGLVAVRTRGITVTVRWQPLAAMPIRPAPGRRPPRVTTRVPPSSTHHPQRQVPRVAVHLSSRGGCATDLARATRRRGVGGSMSILRTAATNAVESTSL